MVGPRDAAKGTMTEYDGKNPELLTENVPLAAMTSFGIGGPARWLACPSNRDELARTADFAASADLPLLCLGGGSNLLVSDAGVDAVVIRLRGEGDFTRIDIDPDDELVWRVGAAVPLSTLVSAAVDAGVSGLEMMAGIPGRVGGAVAMNAGAWSGSMGDLVAEAEVFDLSGGGFRVLTARELGFSYRRSNLGGMIGLRFVLNFSGKAQSETIAGRVREYRERKKASQPLGKPSAGCVFKNPPGDSAGSLLDQAGCKEMSEGAAAVSSLHANFIVNRGGAGSGDVARLAARMREAVWRKFSIALEPELVMWGEDAGFDALRVPLGQV